MTMVVETVNGRIWNW